MEESLDQTFSDGIFVNENVHLVPYYTISVPFTGPESRNRNRLGSLTYSVYGPTRQTNVGLIPSRLVTDVECRRFSRGVPIYRLDTHRGLESIP